MLSKTIPPCSEPTKRPILAGRLPKAKLQAGYVRGQPCQVAEEAQGTKAARGTLRAPPLPGLTGLGGGFDIALPGAAEPQDHARKADRTPRQPALPGPQSFFLSGSQRCAFKDLRPPLAVGRADAGRPARRKAPPRRAAARASRARGRATRKWPPSRRALIGSRAGRFGAAGARAARTAARAAAAAEPAGAEGGRRRLAPGRTRPRAPPTRKGRTPRGRARGATVAGVPPRLASPRPSPGLELAPRPARVGRIPRLASSTWAASDPLGARRQGL